MFSSHLNIVWFNTVDYTPLQLGLFFTGAVLWLVCYAFIVKNIFVNKFCEMPAGVLCANFTWEFLWSFYVVPDMGFLLEIGYKLWFVVDLVIVWGFYRYGFKQVIPEVRHNYRSLFTFGIIGWLVAQYFFIKEGFDNPIGANSAYILNTLISSLYVLMFLRLEKEYKKHLSVVAAWTKCLGTGLISVMVYLKWPELKWVTTLSVVCFFIDLYYIYLVYQFKKTVAQ